MKSSSYGFQVYYENEEEKKLNLEKDYILYNANIEKDKEYWKQKLEENINATILLEVGFNMLCSPWPKIYTTKIKILRKKNNFPIINIIKNYELQPEEYRFRVRGKIMCTTKINREHLTEKIIKANELTKQNTFNQTGNNTPCLYYTETDENIIEEKCNKCSHILSEDCSGYFIGNCMGDYIVADIEKYVLPEFKKEN